MHYCHSYFCCNIFCEKDFKFPRESRAILHVLSKAHHQEVKKKNNKRSTDESAANLSKNSKSTLPGEEAVRRIQNYVTQNVTVRSLPFTAGEMTLDCVAATLSTIAGPKPLSEKATDVLITVGFKDEADAFNRLRYVSGSRKAEGPASASHDSQSPAKRQRVQLKRDAVKRRVQVLGDDVKDLKRKFLESCSYITIIIDEGNNWSKNYPLYVACLTCSPTFGYKIMYIGQVSGQQNDIRRCSLYGTIKRRCSVFSLWYHKEEVFSLWYHKEDVSSLWYHKEEGTLLTITLTLTLTLV